MNNFGYGQLDPNDFANEFNVTCFIVRQMMAQMDVMKLVKVVGAHGGGAAAMAGTVDVQPLVNQVDGNGYATPNGTVYGIPWFRLQGGLNAVVCDPQVGDLGFVVCADRDVSSVKANRAQANPGSARKFNVADGVYVGGIMNAAPLRYVEITDTAIKVHGDAGTTITLQVGANSVVVDASGITFNGPIRFNGVVSGGSSGSGTVDFGAANLTTTGTITSAGKVLSTHHHSGVTVGGGNTGPPT